MTTTTQTFEEFLQQNLSWFDYENLHNHLGGYPRGTTLLIREPKRGNKLQLEKITELLQKWNKGITTDFLVSQFEFGVAPEAE